ncbi:hypothetical protein ILYODFUR_034337 [Ilyodon furcidens]|uniref:Acylphosphatase-like domain-containing protein n=1 Tax=Ilyodon furcidens TaxID=33524 RepID=A0ABV0VJH4_9TELE
MVSFFMLQNPKSVGGKPCQNQDGSVNRMDLSSYTEKEGLRLGLVGWVKNTSRGTVVGQVQGPADMVEEM